MRGADRSTPLRADLRDGKRPMWPGLSRRARVAFIVGLVAVLALQRWLDRVSPGAGLVLGLALQWALALGWLLITAMLWRLTRGVAVRVLLFLCTAWFVGRAGYETYVALG